jgi:ubiquinone/menaquinone biosynthesis C-methylase UbiE
VAVERGLVFDRIAEEYDRARPEYPRELIDRVCARAALQPGSRVVEVGCGTGKLTRDLAARGLELDAIDPGPRLVALARRHAPAPSVRFHVTRFEDAVLPQRVFDAVFSATAFHWVDPALGWSKAASLLKPGGVLALLSHFGGPHLELEEEMLAVWRAVIPEAADWESRDVETLWAGADERKENVSEVWAWLTKRPVDRPEAADLFTDVQVDSVALDGEETAEDILGVVRTTSAYLALDEAHRQQLEAGLSAVLDRAGGVWRAPTFAAAVTARAVA